ncbi:AAA-domain-containing protein [Coniophora puteana RWD-64-598 SS2]|uniref:Peroxisomal ATPase PEX6 n=1 Tax=Coniophora puteana (strain RWD-64-598) TaxID=741705 RepID=A0A5M3N312_CONPW|nr:AAA-domain-containing protein [Coniophora puteana RWD-64-598 SS2]EIW85301.1 AAA-domain-containing protein [Coniophora puteana RWD-64-598 SS2]
MMLHLHMSSGAAKSSPILLHNLTGLDSDILVLRQNFAQDHSIPLAAGITLARISSGVSASRRFEASYLRALHSYFGRSKRLIARHDVIAVPLNTDVSLYMPDDARATADAEAQTGSYLPLASRPNDLVFFIVREVTVEPRSSRSAQNHDSDYGYWIDPAVTRISEVGAEERRIPDVLDYLGTGHLASEVNTIYCQILQFANASTAGGSTDFGLDFSILLKGARGIGKFSIVAKVAQHLGLHLFEINCFDVVADSDVNADAMLRFRLDTALASAPCIIALRHVDALIRSTTPLETAKESEMSMMILEYIDKFKDKWVSTGSPVIVIATVAEHARVPPEVARCFKQELTIKAPDEVERLNILTPLMTGVSSKDVSLQDIATQSAALVASDLNDILSRAQTSLKKRILDQGSVSFDSYLTASGDDFHRALQNVRSFYSQSIGAPKIPNVSWDDIGGLAQTRNDILDTVQLPLDHPELFAGGLKKRSGILLFGPPGTGKTLLAKAVATTCSLNFFSVKGPELLNMYIGESEANVRRLFQRARDAKPCVIFFDELDSVAPKRGNQGDSGGVMDRIVSQLLAELDGISSTDGSADVFVIGATNRPDLLDPALLRPGRFDRMLYLGVSKSHEDQADILRALTRKFKLDTALDLDSLATRCPMNYTGADFYALCSDAMLNAMSRKVDELDTRLAGLNGSNNGTAPTSLASFLTEVAKPEELDVLVSESDFELAMRDLIPSVSQSEMEHYHVVQRQFSQNV